MTFSDTLRESPTILTEGAVIERLRRDPRVTLHDRLAHAAFHYDQQPAQIMRDIYRQYLDLGNSARLPMICLTPTWRANPERLRETEMSDRDVNGDAVRFLDSIRRSYGDYARSIFIGGLIGCRGDCYLPEEALQAGDAEEFHREQSGKLAAAGVDFLFASTLPAASEALGIARAFARFGLPYMLSFVLNADATLLDGTPLSEAIRSINSQVFSAPIGYMVNCVHHSNLARALELNPQPILGLQANTSARRHDELEGSEALHSEDPEAFAHGMLDLHERFGLRILGGCCGTDERHIRALAAKLLQKT